jgi:hypothetical protein
MSEDEIDSANRRLADPPDLDVAVTRRMGLYVVARLAKRHNIVVRLRDNEDIEGGLIARINVPAELVAPAGPGGMQSTSMTLSGLSPLTGDLETTSSLSGPVTSANRASGIAGAFTGSMPRLRSDGGVAGESQVDRPAQEVAGYPPYSPAYGAVAPANGGGDGGWTSRSAETVVDDGHRNGAHEETGAPLFGDPLAEAAAGEQTQVAPQPRSTDGALNIDAPTERLPIYEAVLSQWFEATDTGAQQRITDKPATTNGGPPAETVEEPVDEPVEVPAPTPWVSPGDDGWQAARALLENTEEDPLTSAGLPKRVPKAHLVPGSAAPRHEADDDEQSVAAMPLPPRTADAVRGRMSSYQQGVRRGRHALIEAYAGDQSGSDQSRQDEEQE